MRFAVYPEPLRTAKDNLHRQRSRIVDEPIMKPSFEAFVYPSDEVHCKIDFHLETVLILAFVVLRITVEDISGFHYE